ncbi:terminase gpA endonuclease subunit (plasmid) [Microbulbifer sp. ANSA001]|uniref:terminase gpA endonuclease subunit n=1 Tax=Microbulbifer sp. ANSA001 TaxID=3243358 RepID=UPI00404109B8
MKKTPPVSGVVFADKNFYLPAESSHISGRWTTQPTQVAPLNMMTSEAIREVYCQKSARWGFTKVAAAAVTYFTVVHRRSGVVYLPNDKKAEKFVSTELDPVIKVMPVLQDIFPDWKSKNENNSVSRKQGLGWILDILGAHSPSNFDAITKQFLFGDEVDRWVSEAGKSGDPIKAALTRLEGAVSPKAIFGGTPTTAGASHIQRLMESAAAKFRCYISCPHCGHEQTLLWGGPDVEYGIRWNKKKDKEDLTGSDVWYQCAGCDDRFFYRDLEKIEQDCRWIADDSGIWTRDGEMFFTKEGEKVRPPRTIGLYISSLYSLTLTDGWVGLVRKWLEIAGDRLKRKTFINTDLGELWVEEQGEKPKAELLYDRREVYAAPVPMGGLYLTCFIDTQGDRFEGVVVAWGAGEESWTVDYFKILGDLHQEIVWDQLERKIRDVRYRHESGIELGISRFGIDTGGHFTSQVHTFVRRFPAHYGFACRGDTRYEQPVVTYHSKLNKHGTRSCVIGTDTATDTIYARYKILPEPDEDGALPDPKAPCPGRIHWPVADWCTHSFFKQATADEKKLGYSRGKLVYKYETPSGVRNEVIDCYKGNLAVIRAAQQYLGLSLSRLKKNLELALSDAPATQKKPKRKKVTGGV